jgi:hypothetical protein
LTDITDEQYIVLALILQTILNKLLFRVLYKAGVLGAVWYLLITARVLTLYMYIHSCIAKRDNLDEKGNPRSREHTELLVASQFGLGELWEQYGLIGDIIVSLFYGDYLSLSDSPSPSQMTSLVPTFINSLRQIFYIN